MKRSELNVGDEVYYDRSTNWMTSAGGGRKAVIVDTKPYKVRKSRFGFRYDSTYAEDPKGNCVLADVTGWNGNTERTAVPVSHLRGPFEATKAEVEKATAEQREREKADSQRTVNAWAEAKAVEDLARAHGIEARAVRVDPLSPLPVFQVSVAGLCKLLADAYAARIADQD